jgi:RNA polymerase sigma-70 factor, ECF subfamily
LRDAPENYPLNQTAGGRCALVEEHWCPVYHHIYRLCGNTHDAEELTQEAFLRALENFDQFRPGSNLRGWLLRIATNAFLDTKRRRCPEKIHDPTLGLVSPEEPAETVLERNESALKIQQALLQLTATQRAVFALRTFEEMAFSEIANAIGASEATARWHMLQARQQLLKMLGGEL